jgi:hypothetical protein
MWGTPAFYPEAAFHGGKRPWREAAFYLHQVLVELNLNSFLFLHCVLLN